MKHTRTRFNEAGARTPDNRGQSNEQDENNRGFNEAGARTPDNTPSGAGAGLDAGGLQ